jgi:hydroxymethylpyrimidine/phosphomethylpyrimidine kinase
MSQKNNMNTQNTSMKFALTIAGSDSGGGAGIQADLKAFAASGVFGLSAITSVTAQNSRNVDAAFALGAAAVTAQLRALKNDFPIHGIKTGMLVDIDTIKAVQRALANVDAPLVVDPVMIATSGAALLEPSAVRSLKQLMKRATLITPNLPEAQALLGERIESKTDMLAAAPKLLQLGANAVLLKGGHSNDAKVCDLLYTSSGAQWLISPRLAIRGHGTGCTLAAHCAAFLARGFSIEDAARKALLSVRRALKHSAPIGKGQVSTPDPFFSRYRA